MVFRCGLKILSLRIYCSASLDKPRDAKQLPSYSLDWSNLPSKNNHAHDLWIPAKEWVGRSHVTDEHKGPVSWNILDLNLSSYDRE